MYNVLYFYPVLKQNKDRFIEINKKASLINGLLCLKNN